MEDLDIQTLLDENAALRKKLADLNFFLNTLYHQLWHDRSPFMGVVEDKLNDETAWQI